MSKEWNIHLQVTSDFNLPFAIEAETDEEAHAKAKELLKKLSSEKGVDVQSMALFAMNSSMQPGIYVEMCVETDTEMSDWEEIA